jgi:hypothetical protein
MKKPLATGHREKAKERKEFLGFLCVSVSCG